MKDFAMFTDAGNELVARIAEAGRELAGLDGPYDAVNKAIAWADRELERLSLADDFEEATDTAVREAVFTHITG